MIVSASFNINKPEFWLNRAMQYGDGLFETMRVHNGTIPLLKFHLSRLNQSANKLKLDHLSPHVIESAVLKLSQNLSHSCVLKLIVYRADQARTYQPLTNNIEWVVTAHPFITNHNSTLVTLGVAENKLSMNKALAGMKHLSRIEQVFTANELNSKTEYNDLLIVDQKNRIIETTHQNIILVKEDKAYTPKMNNCGVSGVGIKWFESKYNVKKKHIKLKDLCDFDLLLIGNSIRGFKAVSHVHDDQLNQTISFATFHPIHDKINHLWNELFI